MIHILMAVAILTACAPAATEAPVEATEPPQVATEAPATTEEPVAATEAPAEITDTELNVLCTPQEQWCQEVGLIGNLYIEAGGVSKRMGMNLLC